MRSVRVITGGLSERRRRSGIEAAYEHFVIDRRGNLVSRSTLDHYDALVPPFFAWLREARPHVADFDDLDVAIVRDWRVEVAGRQSKYGRPLAASTILDYHRLLKTFLAWARDEGYPVDPRIFRLKPPKTPQKEATVFHINQLRKMLAACREDIPQEELAVRILVGAGLRASELCGLCLEAPDELSDVMMDSVERGRVELRVRWDAGAKGKKSRRVPITPKLGSAIKRYEARYRKDDNPWLLANHVGRPYLRAGIDTMMGRLQGRVGFRVHAHAFRHTFATVATQLGWNLERVRAAMGHADYAVLHRYVRLATERDLGPRKDWEEFIVTSPDLR